MASGGSVGGLSGAAEAAEILGKSLESITPQDIDFAVSLVAQQTVLSAPEMQYDSNINSTIDLYAGGMLNRPREVTRDMYTDELIKLLGEK